MFTTFDIIQIPLRLIFDFSGHHSRSGYKYSLGRDHRQVILDNGKLNCAIAHPIRSYSVASPFLSDRFLSL